MSEQMIKNSQISEVHQGFLLVYKENKPFLNSGTLPVSFINSVNNYFFIVVRTV